MFVIGTAGHVDHGKSTLVKALTGIDPDRLEEEKRREMTIDLGFAWLTLPSGREISLVDVPGHERFIKNMLAGVGGLDAALLVIAADEGIMPQTQEHLDILKLLGIDRGIVALTKRDMVDDEWLDLMVEEIREKLKETGTALAEAPILLVSARTGQGLPELSQALDTLLDGIQPRLDLGRPRLPIDRVFSVSGFGTVVTGTLIEGRLSVGQEIEIQPGHLKSRIRSIQKHKTKIETAEPGNRIALALTGLEVSDLKRGMVVTIPGWLEPTDLLDLRVNVLKDAPVEITQNSRWDFFSGAAETSIGVTLLDQERLKPGESGLLQARLSEPLALAKGDRFILRLASPSQTIAGGVIIDPHPRRHRRFQAEIISGLKTLEKGTPDEILLQQLVTQTVPRDLRSLVEESGLSLSDVQTATVQLIAKGYVNLISEDSVVRESAIRQGSENEPLSATQLVIASVVWERLKERVLTFLQQFHTQFPLKRGMGREELKSRLNLASPKTNNLIVNRLLAESSIVEDKNGANSALSLPGFEVKFTPAQQQEVDNLLSAFRANSYTPPSLTDLGADLDLVTALVNQRQLRKVAEGIYFLEDVYQTMLDCFLKELDQQSELSLAQVRDLFEASRKPVQALLEYWDEQKITRRQGDTRVRW